MPTLKSLICFLVLIGLVAALGSQASGTPESVRVKRQSNQRPQAPLEQDNNRLAVPVSVSAQSNAQSSTSSLTTSVTNDGASRPQAAVTRPKRPKVSVETDIDSELSSLDDEDRPVRVKPKKRKRPTNRRPQVESARYDDNDANEADEDYENCNDDYEFGHGFPEAAMRPMRHFNRMMSGMFNRMRGMAAGDFDDLPAGGNAAVATSTSNGDGYSRMSSVVNNNGRTRGIVSETRNGRTRTRRINSDDDDNEEE